MPDFGFVILHGRDFENDLTEAKYLWFFTAKILICYEYSLDLETFSFGAIKTISIMAYQLILYQERFFHHNLWPFWIFTTLVVREIFGSYPICHPQKHI